MNAVLQRETFSTSRELEYFSTKELRAQIGYSQKYWPVAILRELIDNALDAIEVNGGLPEIEITIANDRITVDDNGPGLPAATIAKSLDYLVRVSDKAYYTSPTRGQMGNALKTVWAAPFVATGRSVAEVHSQGQVHTIIVDLDRIGQRPAIRHDVQPGFVKSGTSVSLHWENSSSLLLSQEPDSYNDDENDDDGFIKDAFDPDNDDDDTAPPSAADLISGFSAFNPHVSFILNGVRIERTAADWKKWRPNDPTSAHWYTEETLRDLIAAYIGHERQGGRAKTVREFVSDFRGLSGTAKQKRIGWTGQYLHDFIHNGDIDAAFVRDLLARMQAESTAPKPLMLGMIGKDHLTAWMSANAVTSTSITYNRQYGLDDDGLPYVIETGFGVNEDDNSGRRILVGLNWSPVIGSDPDPVLCNLISEARLDAHDPVTLIVHMAKPRFQFADRGKTRLAL